MSTKNINTISWIIHEKPETAEFWVDEKKEPVPKEIWDTILTTAKKPGKIAIIWNDGKPVYFAEFKGKTLRDFFNSIYNETQKLIGPKNSDQGVIYYAISRFYKANMRLELVKSYERGKLKVADLIGDHCFYDGGISKEKYNGESIWVFGLGS